MQDFKPRAGTYMVFGAGPRYCPGNNFARVQVMMFLHHACLKYRYAISLAKCIGSGIFTNLITKPKHHTFLGKPPISY